MYKGKEMLCWPWLHTSSRQCILLFPVDAEVYCDETALKWCGTIWAECAASKWAAASEASKRNFTALTITGVTSRKEWSCSQDSWSLYPAVPQIHQPTLSHLYVERLKHGLVIWPLLDFYCCWVRHKYLARHSSSSQHRHCSADTALGRNFFVLQLCIAISFLVTHRGAAGWPCHQALQSLGASKAPQSLRLFWNTYLGMHNNPLLFRSGFDLNSADGRHPPLPVLICSRSLEACRGAPFLYRKTISRQH